MNGWFGDDWGAPVCQDTPHRDTPVGTPCMDCGKPVADGDQGIVMPSVDSETDARTLKEGDAVAVSVAATHLDCILARFGVTGLREDVKLVERRPSSP